MTIRANSPRQRFQKRASPLASVRNPPAGRILLPQRVPRRRPGRFSDVFWLRGRSFHPYVLLRSPSEQSGFRLPQGGEFRRTAVWERGRRSWDAREWRLVYRVGLFEFSQFGRIRVILILQGMEFLLALRQRLRMSSMSKHRCSKSRRLEGRTSISFTVKGVVILPGLESLF